MPGCPRSHCQVTFCGPGDGAPDLARLSKCLALSLSTQVPQHMYSRGRAVLSSVTDTCELHVCNMARTKVTGPCLSGQRSFCFISHSWTLRDIKGRQEFPIPVDVPTLCCEPAPTFTGGCQGVLTLTLTLTHPTDPVSHQAGVGGPHTAVRGQKLCGVAGALCLPSAPGLATDYL